MTFFMSAIMTASKRMGWPCVECRVELNVPQALRRSSETTSPGC